MVKDNYLNVIKDRTGINKKDIDLVINEYFEILKSQLATNQKVTITNFGSFNVKTTKPHEFFSPVDGHKIKTKGITKIYFTSSKDLLNKVTR